MHTVEDQYQYYAYDDQDQHRLKPYRSQDEEDSDPDAGLFIRELVMDSIVDNIETNKGWFQRLLLTDNDNQKLDADVSVLPLKYYNKLNVKYPMEKWVEPLRAYGHHNIKTCGKVNMSCKGIENDNEANVIFYVVDVNAVPRNDCQKLKLIQRVQSREKCTDHVDSISIKGKLLTKEDMFKKYSEVFTGLGHLEGQYHTELDSNITPVIHPPRKFAYLTERKLEQNNVIAKVDKATSWVNSLVVREEVDGTLRVCLDPHDLNRAIKREHFRIATAGEVSRKLSGKKVFSILDEKDGFWHIELDEPSSYELCTFNSPFGRYRFLRMPFGISSAPEVFQKRN